MSTLALASLTCVLLSAELSAAVTVSPGELTLSSRVSYLLSDGRHPFVDDDARRALLNLVLTCDDGNPILGFDHLTIDQAVSDADEALLISLPQTSGSAREARGGARRGARARMVTADEATFAIGLPAAAKPYAGLARLRGHLELLSATGNPVSWTIALADLARSQTPHQVADQPSLTVGMLEATEPGRVTLVLSSEARWGVVGIDAEASDGTSLKLRSPRIEHRYPPHALPGVEQMDTMTWTPALPAGALLAVRYYPHLVRQPVSFALAALHFGMQLPSAAAVLHGQPRGANDL